MLFAILPVAERCGAAARHPEVDRADLESRWLHLTRKTLPALAAARAWPVSADHCFQRILLDHVVGGCWYDHVARRPAYRHLAADALAQAVAAGEALAAGTADLHALNRQSLAWRRSRKASSAGLP
jgi:hypothetical protein